MVVVASQPTNAAGKHETTNQVRAVVWKIESRRQDQGFVIEWIATRGLAISPSPIHLSVRVRITKSNFSRI